MSAAKYQAVDDGKVQLCRLGKPGLDAVKGCGRDDLPKRQIGVSTVAHASKSTGGWKSCLLNSIGCNELRTLRKIELAELVRLNTYRQTITMNISKFARSACPFAAAAALATVPPPALFDVPVCVPPGVAAVPDDTFGAGCHFHALLRRMADNDPLSTEEKTYLPWLSALRTGLRSIGARRIEPEVPLHCLGSVPAGVCDLRVGGGPADRGIVEVKVVTELPTTAPRTKDIVQLAAYVALSVNPWRRRSVWGAIAYVSFRDQVVRLFVFEDAATMGESAERLFAAAA